MDLKERKIQTIKKIINGKDYYHILDVDEKATTQEIKTAYKKLALLIHPDKNEFPGATQAFQRLGEAYSTLSDPSQRYNYDRTRNNEMDSETSEECFMDTSEESSTNLSDESSEDASFESETDETYKNHSSHSSKKQTYHSESCERETYSNDFEEYFYYYDNMIKKLFLCIGGSTILVLIFKNYFKQDILNWVSLFIETSTNSDDNLFWSPGKFYKEYLLISLRIVRNYLVYIPSGKWWRRILRI